MTRDRIIERLKNGETLIADAYTTEDELAVFAFLLKHGMVAHEALPPAGNDSRPRDAYTWIEAG